MLPVETIPDTLGTDLAMVLPPVPEILVTLHTIHVMGTMPVTTISEELNRGRAMTRRLVPTIMARFVKLRAMETMRAMATALVELFIPTRVHILPHVAAIKV